MLVFFSGQGAVLLQMEGSWMQDALSLSLSLIIIIVIITIILTRSEHGLFGPSAQQQQRYHSASRNGEYSRW